MERRDLFKVIAAGALVEIAPAQDALRYFKAAEDKLVDRLADIIIPDDQHSPGASAAKASRILDVILAYSDPAIQRRWSSGLKAVEAAALARFDKPFLDCTAEQQDGFVGEMARGEAAPKNEIEHFFVLLKRGVIDAYRYSRVGVEQFVGMKHGPIDEFPGCDHKQHSAD